jgi:hypothetical protein
MHPQDTIFKADRMKEYLLYTSKYYVEEVAMD